jgi:two-component system phosphate regulon sensor histidine kinase PhoR
MTKPVAWSSGRIRFFRRPFHELRLTQRVALSQMPLFVTTLFTVFLVWAFFPGTLENPLFAVFVISQLAIMGICYVTPWERLPYTSFLIVPLLDFISIGFAREGGQESLTTLGLLSVFPVIWLCASGYYPRAALWLSFLGPLAIIWVPLLLKGASTAQEFTRALLLPVIMLGIGVSVSVLTHSMMRQQRQLEDKDAQLQANLQTSQRQEALLNTVLDTVHLGVLAVDADGHDVLMNRKQRVNHELARPKDIADPDESQLLVYGPDRKTLVPVQERPVRRAVLGETFTDYLVWLGSGNEQRAFVTTARAMKDADGKFSGSVIAFSDVTDLVNALAAKDDFVSSVSHEFRTPLTSILGYVEILLSDEPEESQRDMLEIIRRNSERLLTLVSDLLSSRNGQLIVSPHTVDVADLVRSSVSSAMPKAAASGVVLAADTPERLEAHVDGARISQVLDNLVSNAIKYSPDGGNVLVTLAQEDGHLACRVSDTGMGMSPEDASEVFAKFFRTSSVRRTAIPGVGLGLPISKAIVEAHGGTIEVESDLGKGTTFTFRVPV